MFAKEVGGSRKEVRDQLLTEAIGKMSGGCCGERHEILQAECFGFGFVREANTTPISITGCRCARQKNDRDLSQWPSKKEWVLCCERVQSRSLQNVKSYGARSASAPRYPPFLFRTSGLAQFCFLSFKQYSRTSHSLFIIFHHAS